MTYIHEHWLVDIDEKEVKTYHKVKTKMTWAQLVARFKQHSHRFEPIKVDQKCKD